MNTPLNSAIIEALQDVAFQAERLVREAYPLQEQFNPETYEVGSYELLILTQALQKLEDLEVEQQRNERLVKEALEN